MNFADRMTAKRKELGISIPLLSEMTGISVGDLEEIEDGSYAKPRIKTAQKIVDALRMEGNTALVEFADPFMIEVIDALIVRHIFVAEHNTNPKKALKDLLDWEVNVALDPSVSAEAQALIRMGSIAELAKMEAVSLPPGLSISIADNLDK